MLLAATPLIFTGLAVAVAFRVGYYNIGAEGQFLAGAMATTAVALSMPDLPGVAALPVGLIAGALGGVAWAFLPAFLLRQFLVPTRWSPPCCSTLWRCCCCRGC